jgi:myo-inositol-1(or 4)-monophosphatase
LSEVDFQKLLRVAEQAAREAGEALRTHRSQWSGVEAVIGREVKVNADKKAEVIVLDALKVAGPMPVLSEEAGWVQRDLESGGLAWAVDPLDGSVNYIQGFPHCAVSIALLQNGKPVLGIVNCFMLDEMYSGAVGVGAWLNGQPISVSDVADPRAGILNTGIPARAATDGEAFAEFMREMLAWRKVRMIGSAAAALAYVAGGRADFYRESGAMLWDVAGGCALVEAAGGVAKLVGPALDQPLIVSASNARLASRIA